MPCKPELAAAYRDAEYVVFGDSDLALRAGEPLEENRAAAAQFDRALADANYSRCPGEGRNPKGPDWSF